MPNSRRATVTKLAGLGRQVRDHGVQHRPALVGDADEAVGQGLDEADAT